MRLGEASVLNDSAPAEALLERVFGASVAHEYPLVFQRGFDGAVVGIEVDRAVRAACAILRRELVTPERTIACGLIGSVATDPDWRGRGLATRVLESAESELRARGASLALLWADDPAFYRARGYAPIGAEIDVSLPASLAARLHTLGGVRAFRRGDEDDVHGLYMAHRWRVERSLAETIALLDVPRMRVLVLERDHRVVAYACTGRGRDFSGVIHEWGGAARDVAALVRAHIEERLTRNDETAMYLMAPAREIELVELLQCSGAQITRGVLGLGKPLDHSFDPMSASDAFVWGLDSI